jgi:hypothetical protein
MSPTEPQPFRLSRRRALAGAAWSAPVIVVASAVPAFATSGGGALDLKRGASAAVVTTDGVATYHDLQFTGLSVVVPANLSAGQLTLTVTFTPTSPGGPAGLYVLGQPAAWPSSPAPGGTSSTVVLAYASSVTAGTEVQVPSGIFVGAELPTSAQTGTYVVTASAPGLTSDVESCATAALRSARGVTPVPRPVVG